MRVYILRHGIAEDATPGGSDANRALTARGKQKLHRVLQCGREAGVRPSVILTSPLRRALETAEIAAAVLNVKGAPLRTNALAPAGSPARIWEEIRAQRAAELLITGHEPLLSRTLAFLLRSAALRVNLKKGALASLDIEGAEPEPHGVLNWILTPKLAGC